MQNNNIVNNKIRKTLLCILDGFAFGEKSNPFNAYEKANKTHFPKILDQYPNTLLECSGNAVGLPDGQMGNSEIGHIAIGSGQIIEQMLPRINNQIKNKTLFRSKEFEFIKNSKKDIHIIGLFSNGGVHSHCDHILEITKYLSNSNKVYNHIITDGRDCNTKDALELIEKNKDILNIATISGRFYAMDRDKRWDRIYSYYDLLLGLSNEKFESPNEYMNDCYSKDITDEFVYPAINANFKGIKDGDIILFTNFRPDRARQLLLSIFDNNFDGFHRNRKLNNIKGFTMTDYFLDDNKTNKSLAIESIIQKEEIKNTISEIASNNNLRQLKVTETEKYAHVTFFFNGEKEAPFRNEDRVLIQSKKVNKYNEIPEMSAYEIRDTIVDSMSNNKHDFIVCNIANGDMIGHTGDFNASIKAVEVIDEIIGDFLKYAIENEYTLIITADHGNIESMKLENGEINTKHTLSKVPFIVANHNKKIDIQNMKSLLDIKKITLEIIGIEE